jgi:hypothetical protein
MDIVERIEPLFSCRANGYDLRVLRMISVWLLEVGLVYDRKPTTISLTFRLLNDYLCRETPDKNELQGYGLACLSLADSLNEIYVADPDQYVDLCKRGFSEETIEEFKVRIVKALSGRIRPPTALDVLKTTVERETGLILYSFFPEYFDYDVLEVVGLCQAVTERERTHLRIFHDSPLVGKWLKDRLKKSLALRSEEKTQEKTYSTSPNLVRTEPFFVKPGQYTIVRTLGHGHSGPVYLVEKSGKPLALKHQRVRETSLTELSILSTYSHKNVISLELKSLEVGEMELYLEIGQSLFDILRPELNPSLWLLTYVKGNNLLNPRPLEERRKYNYDLCRGLNYLHSHGIIHRDVKSQNIIVVDGTAKLSDFGSSLYAIADEERERVVVTLYNRPPELLNPKTTNYSFEIDVWSLGCVFAEMETRIMPFFEGTEEGTLAKINQVLTARTPLSCVSDVPFRNVLLDMLKIDPSERISPEEILSRLSEYS